MDKTRLLKALQSQYQGQMDIALANIEVYIHNPAGIGEHPDLAAALEGALEVPQHKLLLLLLLVVGALLVGPNLLVRRHTLGQGRGLLVVVDLVGDRKIQIVRRGVSRE